MKSLRVSKPPCVMQRSCWKSLLASTALFAITIAGSAQHLTFVTNRVALGAEDYIDWGSYGFGSSAFPAGSNLLTHSGLSFRVSDPLVGGGFFDVHNTRAPGPSDLLPTEPALRTPYTSPNGKLRIEFATPVARVGAQVENRNVNFDIGPTYNAYLDVFSGTTLLGEFTLIHTVQNLLDGSAPFLGVLSDAANITAVEFYVTSFNEFWLNEVSLSLQPAPRPVPIVLRNPQSQSAVAGINITFVVLATGPLPLNYQWLLNGANLVDIGRDSGSRSNVLAISNVQTSDAGNYQVIVTNSYGSATSAVATLTVQGCEALPSITCPPNITVGFANEQGAVVAFAATATDVCSTVTIACLPASGSPFPIGTNFIVCTASDVSGHSASCAFEVLVHGARGVKQSVLADLIALRSTVNGGQAAERLEDATDELAESLATRLWLDETHVQAKLGEEMFDEEKETVHELHELVRSKTSSILERAVKDLLEELVRADRLLAMVAIQDATQADGSLEAFAAANKVLAEGDRDLAQGRPDEAVDDYGKAWAKAAHRLGKTTHD